MISVKNKAGIVNYYLTVNATPGMDLDDFLDFFMEYEDVRQNPDKYNLYEMTTKELRNWFMDDQFDYLMSLDDEDFIDFFESYYDEPFSKIQKDYFKKPPKSRYKLYEKIEEDAKTFMEAS